MHSKGRADISSSTFLVVDGKMIANTFPLMGLVSDAETTLEEAKANAERIATLWNAADSLSNEEAAAILKARNPRYVYNTLKSMEGK